MRKHIHLVLISEKSLVYGRLCHWLAYKPTYAGAKLLNSPARQHRAAEPFQACEKWSWAPIGQHKYDCSRLDMAYSSSNGHPSQTSTKVCMLPPDWTALTPLTYNGCSTFAIMALTCCTTSSWLGVPGAASTARLCNPRAACRVQSRTTQTPVWLQHFGLGQLGQQHKLASHVRDICMHRCTTLLLQPELHLSAAP